MLRLGGASPVAQQYARAWQCPVCAESAAPARARPASTSVRPLAFNDTVAADLKYLRDAEGSKMVVLCIVDAGTAFQQAVLLRNRTPKHVAKRFVQTWIQPYGAPRVIVHDQGGEFQAVFLSMLDNWAIESQVAGSHAGWQASLIERHGSLLSTVWRKLVHQHRVAGRKHAKMALVASVLAKNACIRRHGYTPEQAVFGRALRWPPSLALDDDDQIPWSALTPSAEQARANRMRETARLALVRLDAKNKLRRAVLRKPPPRLQAVMPGTRV